MNCGKINMCAEMDCKFKCCNFDVGNYILLFPGELDDAVKNNKNISHLTILENDKKNGHKAVCTAKQKQNCDNGYKPLDCLFYPFFPKELKRDELTMFKGIKCPLKVSEINNHILFVHGETQKLLLQDRRVKSWIKKVKLVGYETVEIKVK